MFTCAMILQSAPSGCLKNCSFVIFFSYAGVHKAHMSFLPEQESLSF